MYERLRAWRNEEAARQNLPAYTIFQQKAILGISNLLPVDREMLLRIPYVGKKGVERYGDVLLEMIHAYRKEKGLDALQRALNMAKENNYHQEIIVTSLLLGKYYFTEKDWTQSLDYFNDQIKHARIIHDIPNEAEGYLWIGSVFYKQKQYNLALDNWRTAEELAVDSHHLPLIYRTGIKRCKVYLEMDKIELTKEIIDGLSTL